MSVKPLILAKEHTEGLTSDELMELVDNGTILVQKTDDDILFNAEGEVEPAYMAIGSINTGSGLMKADPTRPHVCKYCDKTAEKSVIWADGRAFIPVCSSHVAMATHQIKIKNKDAVCKIVAVKKAGESKLAKSSGLLDKLAVLEHEQWVMWSKVIAEKENISPDTLERWRSNWVGFDMLPDNMKEEDRKIARKVIEIITDDLLNYETTNYLEVEPEGEAYLEPASDEVNGTCFYCECNTNKLLIWAGGSRILPVCNDHLLTAVNKIINENSDQINLLIDLDSSKVTAEHDINPILKQVEAMPYRTNASLPDAVKNALPAEAQTVFRNVFNNVEAGGASEESSFAQAWGALRNQGWEKQSSGKWIKVKKYDYTDADIQELAKRINQQSEHHTVVIKVAPKKTEDGKQYPASDYAYVPDSESPSTWKLRLTSVPGGEPDPRIIGAALAALGPGFRGQKVSIPAADMPKVKEKVRAAWRKVHPDASAADMPSIIKSDDSVDFEHTVSILKAEDEKQLITGIVLEPDTTDAHGDRISAEEIEKAAHEFLKQSRLIGLQHKKPGAVSVVESFLTPVDMELGGQSIKKGSWVMTAKVNDSALWNEVKKGDYTGFSIGGYGMRK